MKRLQFNQDHDDGFTVLYRDKLVGEFYTSLEYREWYAEFHPTRSYTVETSKRAARRWVREHAEHYDLETWYALHVGAKEL